MVAVRGGGEGRTGSPSSPESPRSQSRAAAQATSPAATRGSGVDARRCRHDRNGRAGRGDDRPDPQPAVAPRSGGSGTPIKIAIMSDCQGAFGSFDNQNMAGAVAAISQFAGAKPKNPNKPKDGFTGGAIGNHPLKLVGVGCGNDQADTAIKETRRLMEQLNADVMIGPLSGDESIAVANYAKQHPDKTFVDGSAGAQDTTLKVQAPNFFRFNGDGAQWNAGLGDLAFNKLGWKKAAIISDDYSFGWTSTAGFIADFCAAGGQITKRVFPPLNTTDYSSYAQQLPDDVDGTFVAVGGAGLIPFLKAYEQAKGPIDSQEVHRQPVLGHAGPVRAARSAGRGRLHRRRGHGRRPGHPGGEGLRQRTSSASGSRQIPPGGAAAPQAASTFTYGYYVNTWGLIKGLEAVKGDISGGQKKLQEALAKVDAARSVRRDQAGREPSGGH